MRVLAIRGANIASLAAPFEIDFTAEPLASAGLFAIAGPTGAGKTTLLDTLCLALFDNAPRLGQARARDAALPDVGDLTILPGDSRNLLRRGASEGYAEADFIGQDGVAYRARWVARRARNKADGRLQDVEMSLLRVADGSVVAGPRKSEARDAIVARLGLRYEQFTRAVLLAQNEFFAFLKAGEDERATLLQALTGTEQFEQLSRLAFERQRREGAALQRLQDQLEGSPPLEEEARRALDGALAHARESERVAQQAHAQARSALEWMQTRLALQRACDEAAARAETAQQTWAAADAARQYLVQVERAQGARAPYEHWQHLHAEAEALQTELPGLTQAVQQYMQRRVGLDDAVRAAQAGRDRAVQVLQAAEPVLADAAQREGALRLLDESLQRATAALAQASTRDTTQAQRLEGAQAALSACEQQLQGVQTWLGGQTALARIVPLWPRLQLLLEQAEQGLAQHQRAAQARQQAHIAVQRSEAALAGAAAHLPDAREQAEHALEARVRAAAQLAQHDSEALAGRRSVLEARWRSAEEGIRRGELQQRQVTERDALLQKQQTLQAQQAQRLAEVAELSVQEQGQAGAAEQAGTSLRQCEAACHASVESLRAALSDDAACPVCGSTRHPYADAAASQALHALLETQREAYTRCQAALQHTRERLLQARAEGKALAAGLEALIPPLEQAGMQCVAATQAWTQWQGSCLLHAQEAATLTDVQTAASQCRAQLMQQAADEAAARAAQVTFNQAIEAEQGAQLKLQRIAQEVETQQRAHQQDARQLAQCRDDEDAADTRLAASMLALEEGFGVMLAPDWRVEWQRDAGAFRNAWSARISAWQARRAECDVLLPQVEQARSALRSAQIEREQAAQQCATAREEASQLQARLTEERRALQQLLQRDGWVGTSVDAVRRSLETAVELARQSLDSSATALQTAQTEQVRAEDALTRAQQRLLALQGRVHTAWAEVEVQLQALGADLPRLQVLLQHDSAWLEQQRAAQAALREQLERGKAVAADRQRAAQQHLAQHPEWADATSAAIDETLTQAATLLDAAARARQAEEFRLQQDDQARQRAATLLADIAAQRERTQLWSRMHELMGASDGKKFRNFAQQLTLDVLLAYANQHLATLARRYRLESVRDSLALQVVDQDMGDEVRSVHSLSGGESFLVSLALALGLASLSSHRVQVESLFIDEGFGGLDSDTLRVAMDALDGLQAQGRKVGVISHVQEMTERIGARIEVRRGSGGASRVRVVGSFA